MKNAILATGAALLLAVLLSSPTFAQTAQPPAALPAPAALSADQPAADVPIDELIEAASTPQDRAALLRRCAGPPPRPVEAERGLHQPGAEPSSASKRS